MMKKRWMVVLLPLVLAACSQGEKEIEGVKSFENKGEHQEGQLKYAQTPPTGGTHNPAWQNCGVYDRALYNEYAVHSLEHGAVWITYQSSLAGDQVAQLKQLADGRTHTLVSPHESQQSPVVVTAWNKQLALNDASDPRIKTFLAKYEQGGDAPEIGASCSGAYNGTV
jgi:hypothetical protein